MFGRKIFFLATWYVAGNVINALYNTKKKRAIKLQKQEDMKLMVESFVRTQKNFFSDLEKRYVPKEHSSSYEKKKKEFLTLAKKYTQKWKELIKEIQSDERVSQGKDKLEQWLLKAKLHWENAVKTTAKKWKLIAGKIKKDEEKNTKTK